MRGKAGSGDARPSPVSRALLQRGLAVSECCVAERTFLPYLSSAPKREAFRRLLHSYAFRLFLRDIIVLRNRYLLRADHQSLVNLLWTLPATLWRDAAALAWVLVAERSSLAAYAWLWRHRREILAHRRRVRARALHALDRWFLRREEPLPEDAP